MSPGAESARRASVSTDDDWKKITDAGERRRAQNRIAQRNYRRNHKVRLQQSNQNNDIPASSSHERALPQTPQSQSVALHPAKRNNPSTNVQEDRTEVSSDVASFFTSFSDTAEITSFSSDLAITTDGFGMTSPRSSFGEGSKSDEDRCRSEYFTAWADLGSYSSSLSASTTPSVITSSYTPLNALQKAVIKGQHKTAKLLVENGANVCAIDENGNNILHLAIYSGSLILVLFALSNGIDVNDANTLGHTPLHVAIEQDNLDIISILLKAGADTEFKS